MAVTGLERWDWHGLPVVPEPVLRAMLDDPGFAAAYRASVEGALAFADANPVFQAMTLDMGGFFLCFLALYMDATTGITHRALRNLAGGGIVLSASRATAILWKLRSGKFVQPALDGGFVPAAILRDGMRARMRVDLTALRAVEPGLDAALARLDDNRFFAAIIRHLGSETPRGTDRPDDIGFVNVSQISQRAAGMLAVYVMLVSAQDQSAFPPTGRTAISISAIARRFGVSRRHVSRLLHDMEAMGFLASRGEQWELLPALAPALRTFHGVTVLWTLRSVHRALAKEPAAA